jgi:hypothetical protein
MSPWSAINQELFRYNIISNISMTTPKAPYYHRKLAKQGKTPRKYRKYNLEVKMSDI